MASRPSWDDTTATDGTVLGLQILRRHGERPHSVSQVRAMPGHGLEGDIHGKSKPGSRRQVLLVERRTLEVMGLHEGDLREQITVAFSALGSLAPGTLLQVGEATLELTGDCEPCTHIGGLNGAADPEAFRRALQGRRGQTARVLAVEGDGRIRVGDRVAVRAPIPR